MNERKDPRHTDSVLQCNPNQSFQFKNKKKVIKKSHLEWYISDTAKF